MKKRTLIILFLSCGGLYEAKSQQVILDGVYVRDTHVRNGDTIQTVIKGKVIDKKTFSPLSNIRVEYFSSIGQSLATFTDKGGHFEFNNLEGDSIKAKIVCSDTAYKMITWEFNTYGISEPREFKFNFELEKK